MSFEIEQLEFSDAYMIKSFYSSDSRGNFLKTYEKDKLASIGIPLELNEVFVTKSGKNVLRGMHFQLKQPQIKLISVLRGSIYDVIVDLRRQSKTYGKWAGYNLSADMALSLVVPRGFAHGFLSLEDDSIICYQCDGAYNAETDTGIYYGDPELNIQWPIKNIQNLIVSDRDSELMSFLEYRKLIQNR